MQTLNTVLMIVALGSLIFSITKVGFTLTNMVVLVLFLLAAGVNTYKMYTRRGQDKQVKRGKERK